jgi:hypothetical protein
MSRKLTELSAESKKTKWLDGIKSDLEKRWHLYWSDWTDIHSFKILSSSIFIFFTSIAPAVTFSLYMTQSTEGQLGAIEILLSTALTGILFSIFGGQPMVILGVTGPVTILITSVYALSKSWGLKFIPFLAWAQLWAGAMHFLLAMGNYCSLLRYVTQFSCETFGVLIAMIYLYTGLHGVLDMLSPSSATSLAMGYLQLIIAMGTVAVASYLVLARQWTWFNETVRTLISDYGATISIVTWTLLTMYACQTSSQVEDIPTLFIPQRFVTTSGRNWFVDLTDIPLWGIFASIFPGFIITVLFFFDHNVSSIMAQHKDFGLQKGTAFHWDFLVLGVCVIMTGILGIPPTNGLIPQAPLHTKSLMVKSRKYSSSVQGGHEFEIEKIYEQRVTNLLQSILIGLALFFPFAALLRTIPTAVLYGLFVFLGIASFEDNEFALRMSLLFMDSSLYHTLPRPMQELLENVPRDVIYRFTIVQACLCGVIFVSTFTAAGVIFPVLIGCLVIVRQVVFTPMYREEHLLQLDKPVLHDEEQEALATCGGRSKESAATCMNLPDLVVMEGNDDSGD